MTHLHVSICDNPAIYFFHTTMHQPFRRLFLVLFFSLGFLLASVVAYAEHAPLTASQCALMQERSVLTAKNPVPCSRLALVSFRYIDFEGELHDDGHIVVLDVVAPQVEKIFTALLAHRFPLQRAQPLEAYSGDDEASMRDNNTSAFNGRALTGGSAWSKHAYGVAIDLNPLQNPYLSKEENRKTTVLPPAAAPDYLIRNEVRPGMAEAVLDIFFRHGFLIWGGDWKQPVDYQHFEIGSRGFIAHLLALPLNTAQAEFDAYTDAYTTCLSHSKLAAIPARYKTCAAQAKR